MSRTQQIVRLVYHGYVALFLLYLYVPLAVVMTLAFNASPLPAFPWQGFTLQWFREIAGDGFLLRSIWNSLVVGAGVTVLSVTVGTVTAFVLVRYQFLGKGLLYALALSPLIMPGVILGISMLVFFSDVGLETGLFTTVLGQSSFIISFVLLIASARLQKFDRSLEEAAQDLGATPLQAIRRVTLPALRPALVASGVVAFLLSFDNFNTTLFLIGNEATLPIHIYAAVRLGLSPKINAISVVFIVVTAGLGVAYEVIRRREGAAGR